MSYDYTAYNALISNLKSAAIGYSIDLNQTKTDSSDEARERVNKSHSQLIEATLKFGDFVLEETLGEIE